MKYQIGIDELLSIIDRTALECMMTPVIHGKNLKGDPMSMAEIANYNSLISMNNEGIRDMANRLKDCLARDEDGEANG